MERFDLERALFATEELYREVRAGSEDQGSAARSAA
jgi:hypothetical protein